MAGTLVGVAAVLLVWQSSLQARSGGDVGISSVLAKLTDGLSAMAFTTNASGHGSQQATAKASEPLARFVSPAVQATAATTAAGGGSGGAPAAAPTAVSAPAASLPAFGPEAADAPGLPHVQCEGYKYCTLPVCLFHGCRAPRLFVAEHGDGAGHRMKNIFDGIGVAWRNGLNFGGVIPVGNIVTEHGHNFRTMVDSMFGLGACKQMFLTVTRDELSATQFTGVPALERERLQVKEDSNIFVGAANEWDWNKTTHAEDYWPATLRQELGRNLARRQLLFHPGRLAVAIHLRRGDLTPTDSRATADVYYYKLIERIRAVAPDADVHVWSSVQSYSAQVEQGVQLWTSEDFDGYRQRGVSVHLDGDNLLDDWAHFAMARIFVMSKSSFSYTPAVVNQNCVIHPGSFGKPLAGWINGEKLQDELIRECVGRGVKSAMPSAPTVVDAPPEVEKATSAAAGGGCRLRICMAPVQQGLPKGTLYVTARGAANLDEHLRDLVDGLAVAAARGLSFGAWIAPPGPAAGAAAGALGPLRRLVDDFFGRGAADELITAVAPASAATFGDVAALSHLETDAPLGGSLVLLSPPGLWQDSSRDQPAVQAAHLSPAFVRALRRPLELRPLRFEAGLVRVSLHVRPEDAASSGTRGKTSLPKDYYVQVLEKLRKRLPSADVLLWSRLPEGLSDTKLKEANHRFDSHRLGGARVHIHDDSPFTALLNMALAHVLVTSHSNFAYFAALLNVHCVVHPGFLVPSPMGWISGRATIKDPTSLFECLEERLAPELWASR